MKKKTMKQRAILPEPLKPVYVPTIEDAIRHILKKVESQDADVETECQKLLCMANRITEKMQHIIAMKYAGHHDAAYHFNIERRVLCEAFHIMARKGKK